MSVISLNPKRAAAARFLIRQHGQTAPPHPPPIMALAVITSLYLGYQACLANATLT
jgi:hypothetical protein